MNGPWAHCGASGGSSADAIDGSGAGPRLALPGRVHGSVQRLSTVGQADRATRRRAFVAVRGPSSAVGAVKYCSTTTRSFGSLPINVEVSAHGT